MGTWTSAWLEVRRAAPLPASLLSVSRSRCQPTSSSKLRVTRETEEKERRKERGSGGKLPDRTDKDTLTSSKLISIFPGHTRYTKSTKIKISKEKNARVQATSTRICKTSPLGMKTLGCHGVKICSRQHQLHKGNQNIKNNPKRCLLFLFLLFSSCGLDYISNVIIG